MNLSNIAYCDDIIIISSSYGKAITLLDGNGTHIPNVKCFEYLGLQTGSNIFITEFIEEKWKLVKKGHLKDNE